MSEKEFKPYEISSIQIDKVDYGKPNIFYVGGPSSINDKLILRRIVPPGENHAAAATPSDWVLCWDDGSATGIGARYVISYQMPVVGRD